MVNVIPELLLLLLLPSPFTLIGSAALDFYFCLLAFTAVPEERIERERKKRSTTCLQQEVRHFHLTAFYWAKCLSPLEEMDQLEAGEGRGRGRDGGGG